MSFSARDTMLCLYIILLTCVLVAKEEENTNIIIADSEDKVIILAFKPNIFFLV